MDINEYLSQNEELYSSPNDPYWSPFEAHTEIGPQIVLGATGVNHQSPKTLSSGDHSRDPGPSFHAASDPSFDHVPLLFPHEPLTINLRQLAAPPVDGDLHECLTSLLSFLFSDPHPCIDTADFPPAEYVPLSKTPENRTYKQEYLISSDLPFDPSPADSNSDEEYYDSASDVSSTESTALRHLRRTLSPRRLADQSGPGAVDDLNGHPVLRYTDGSYQCTSLVTANGKASQYTRKSERPPDVGQPCGQTFRGRDEIVRHLKTSRWHRKPDEYKPLSCDVCGRRLSRRDALVRHMELHLKQKGKAPKSRTAHSKRRTSNNKLAIRIPKRALQ